MNSKTIWEEQINIKDYPILDKNISTDVLIIGGGITGILCAYELSKRKISCVVVEKNKIGRGTTKNTTAFITAQHEVLYQDLIKKHGSRIAKEYLDINLKALSKYKTLAKEYDFDFTECNSCLFAKDKKDLIIKEKEALESIGYKAKIISDIPLVEKENVGIVFENQGVLHPLKFVKEISKNLRIYEHTMVDKITKNTAYTTNGNKIDFNHVIIATHYPIRNKGSLMFLKLTQRRSYVVAVKDDSIKDTYCSIDDDGIYFRGYQDKLIIGGCDRDTKINCHQRFEDSIKDIIKDKEVLCSYSGQDCIPLDDIPYIGRYDTFHNNYYIATGFGLWGFTWAMASSLMLADMIEGKKDYLLANPKRNFINKNLFINTITAIKNLVTFKKPRCMHMGCALKYNKIEKVWECPCHGSRYDEDGSIIEGPTQKGLE